MRILALNCGSSSIKSAVIDTATQRQALQVRVESIGAAAVRMLLAQIHERSERPAAVVHRVVHGADRFTRPVVIDDSIETAIEALNPLAPLHNPPALAAIRQARMELPDLPHIAVFDTAFHSTLPPHAREYAVPVDVAQKFGVRRYGFHGASHAHVMHSSSTHLRVPPQDLRIVSCHLGNGASLCAIEYGRSVETSMGMTPLEGLIMGTRSGDIDPGVLLHLMKAGNYDREALEELLNEQSGLAGLTATHDMREIEQRAAQGDESCGRALSMYAHRIRKYIGAYAAVMGGVDVLAFTGGVGENSAQVRDRIAQRLDFLGIAIDAPRNAAARTDLARPLLEISAAHSRARVLVIRADEEMSMARDAAALLGEERSSRAV